MNEITDADVNEFVKLFKKTQQTRSVSCVFCLKLFKDKRRANKCIMSHNSMSETYPIREKKRNSSEVILYSPDKRNTSSNSISKIDEDDQFDLIIKDLKDTEKLIKSMGMTPTSDQLKQMIMDSIGKFSLSTNIVQKIASQRVDSLKAVHHALVAQINEIEAPKLKVLSDESGKNQYERTVAHKLEVETHISNNEYDLKYLKAYQQHHYYLFMWSQSLINRFDPTLDMYVNIRDHFDSVAGEVKL